MISVLKIVWSYKRLCSLLQ